MIPGKLVFAQVTVHLPLTTVRRCVARYSGEHKVKTFSCLEQYLCMAFAQLTYRESLRDIEACLRAQTAKLYYMGIESRVSRSTLADANEVRDWRMVADFAQSLIGRNRTEPVYRGAVWRRPERDGLRVRCLDDLCLSVFPWTPFRSTKAAIKLHTLLDLRGNVPTFLLISDGTLHDVNVLDLLLPEPGAFYVMDRAYLDFERLNRLHAAGGFFVTRAKSHLKAGRRYSHPVDRSAGLICDQTIVLTGFYSRQGFDTPLRRIKFKDPETGKRLVFLTNNFPLPAITITDATLFRQHNKLKWVRTLCGLSYPFTAKLHSLPIGFARHFEQANPSRILTASCAWIPVLGIDDAVSVGDGPDVSRDHRQAGLLPYGACR